MHLFSKSIGQLNHCLDKLRRSGLTWACLTCRRRHRPGQQYDSKLLETPSWIESNVGKNAFFI